MISHIYFPGINALSRANRAKHRFISLLDQLEANAIDCSWTVRDGQIIAVTMIRHRLHGWRLVTPHPHVSYDWADHTRTVHRLSPLQRAENVIEELTNQLVYRYYHLHRVDGVEGYMRLDLATVNYEFTPDWPDMN